MNERDSWAGSRCLRMHRGRSRVWPNKSRIHRGQPRAQRAGRRLAELQSHACRRSLLAPRRDRPVERGGDEGDLHLHAPRGRRAAGRPSRRRRRDVFLDGHDDVRDRRRDVRREMEAIAARGDAGRRTGGEPRRRVHGRTRLPRDVGHARPRVRCRRRPHGVGRAARRRGSGRATAYGADRVERTCVHRERRRRPRGSDRPRLRPRRGDGSGEVEIRCRAGERTGARDVGARRRGRIPALRRRLLDVVHARRDGRRAVRVLRKPRAGLRQRDAGWRKSLCQLSHCPRRGLGNNAGVQPAREARLSRLGRRQSVAGRDHSIGARRPRLRQQGRFVLRRGPRPGRVTRGRRRARRPRAVGASACCTRCR